MIQLWPRWSHENPISSYNNFVKLLLLLPKNLLTLVVDGLLYFSLKFRKQFIGARILQISIASGCNHNCEFCITDVHGEGAFKYKNPLNFGQFTQVVDDAISNLTLRFNLLSNGEPTLSPYFKDLCDYISKRSHGKACIKVVTNGTSLFRFQDKFYKNNNIEIWLSLHSPVFEVWNRIHRSKDFDPRESFDKMKLKLISLSKFVPITIHIVLTKDSAKTLFELYEFLKQINPVELHFGELSGHDNLNLRELSYEELKKAKNDLEDLHIKLIDIKSIKKDNIEYARNIIENAMSDVEKSEEEEEQWHEEDQADIEFDRFYLDHKCYIPYLMSFIDEDGELLTCYPGLRLGSLKQGRYKKLVKSKNSKFLKNIYSIDKNDGKVQGCNCQECPHKEINHRAHELLNGP